MPVRSRTKFVAGFLGEFLERQFVDGEITSDEYHARRRKLEAEARKLSRFLFEKPSGVDDPDFGSLKLRMLREPDLREFPFIQVIPRPSNRRRIRCFVGHRFAPKIEKSLRYNLRHLFEPYRIDLEWSGYDLATKNVFEDIIQRIRTSGRRSARPTSASAPFATRAKGRSHAVRSARPCRPPTRR